MKKLLIAALLVSVSAPALATQDGQVNNGNSIANKLNAEQRVKQNQTTEVSSSVDVSVSPIVDAGNGGSISNRSNNTVYVPPALSLSNTPFSNLSCDAVISQSASGLLAGLSISWRLHDDVCNARADAYAIAYVTGDRKAAVGRLCQVPEMRAALAAASTEYDVICFDVEQSVNTYNSQH